MLNYSYKLLGVSAGRCATYGKLYSLDQTKSVVGKNKLILLAEMHANPPVVALQKELQAELLKNEKVNLHVFLEHFSFEQQHLLDGYQKGELTLEELNAKYKEIGTENHDIMKYKEALEHARENSDRIRLVGGFIPRTYARLVMRESEESAIKAALEKEYIPKGLTSFTSSEFHYNMFESMISGRNMFDANLQPKDNFRKLFKAQLIKDYSMAHKVSSYIREHNEPNDKYLVVSGKGHMQYF